MKKKQYNKKMFGTLNKLKKYNKEYFENKSNEKYKFISNEESKERIINKINSGLDKEKILDKPKEEINKNKYCDACECNPCDCDWGN